MKTNYMMFRHLSVCLIDDVLKKGVLFRIGVLFVLIELKYYKEFSGILNCVFSKMTFSLYSTLFFARPEHLFCHRYLPEIFRLNMYSESHQNDTDVLQILACCKSHYWKKNHQKLGISIC